MSLTKRMSPDEVGGRDLNYEAWSEEFYPEPTEEELIEMAGKDSREHYEYCQFA